MSKAIEHYDKFLDLSLMSLLKNQISESNSSLIECRHFWEKIKDSGPKIAEVRDARKRLAQEPLNKMAPN